MSESNDVIVQTGRGPSIKGTRITIYQLMEYLKDGWTPKHTAQWFNLTPAQMDGVMAYLQAHEAELEIEYAEVMRKAEEQERYWRERNKDREKLPVKPPSDYRIAIARARLAAIKQERERCKS